MGTTSIHVTLPKALKEHIEKRVAAGEFTSPSDYVRALIRAEREREIEEHRLEQMLLEGVASEQGMEVGAKEWGEYRKRIKSQTGRENTPKTA